MPPDRGRASRACNSCRKQKTRCYESGVSGRPCFRCERLRQRCSFVQTPPDNAAGEVPTTSNAERILKLERTVGALLERLGEDSTTITQPTMHTSPSVLHHAASNTDTAHTVKPDSQSGPPVMIIRELASDAGIKSLDPGSQVAGMDGLIPPDLALSLLAIFLEHYGRWVMFDPSSDPKALLSRISGSPLLLCACFLIAVRHTSETQATTLAPKLYHFSRSLVSTALLESPQPIEFFQAAIILSMWSTTVGQVPLSIDSWLLSGFALQHCQSSPHFDAVNTFVPTAPLSKATLDNWCLWNHLCLVHLHYCVATSRKSMLHAAQVSQCRVIVGSDHATNYELRMVAEIYLYWSIYENTVADCGDLLKSIASLQDWKREWEFVLEQPRSQFLLMGFHFAHLILYDQSLKSKTARAQESTVSEMIRHATSIIRLAIDTTDDRTRHLSDHIYHMITFAAIIICRLLSGYEDKLRLTQSISELDLLIRSLVNWLRSIGLPCHAAHTLSHIIEQVLHKSRPEIEQSPQSMDQADNIMGGDIVNYFPEFLGVEPTSDGNWDLLPTWGLSPE